jgi:hypothetical protein
MLLQVTLRNVGLLAARHLKAAISSPLVALGAAAPPGAAADNTDVWTALQGTWLNQSGLRWTHKHGGACRSH